MVTKRQLDRFNNNLAQVIKDIITFVDKKRTNQVHPNAL